MVFNVYLTIESQYHYSLRIYDDRVISEITDRLWINKSGAVPVVLLLVVVPANYTVQLSNCSVVKTIVEWNQLNASLA